MNVNGNKFSDHPPGASWRKAFAMEIFHEFFSLAIAISNLSPGGCDR